MIEYRTGNIFETDAEVIVIPVSLDATAKNSLTEELSLRCPEVFKAFRTACKLGRLEPGNLVMYKLARGNDEYNYLMFPTKLSWRNKDNIPLIEAGLVKFRDEFSDRYPHITSVAFPKLGYEGDLGWDEVKNMMEDHLAALNIKCVIYE